jgi:5'-nucleotidase
MAILKKWEKIEMRILITNDDGIEAEGLKILAEVLSVKYDVYVVAPDQERSACSNAITVRDEIKVKKITDRSFAVSGFPADCVNVGFHSGIIPEIDVVVSGINHGANLGDDLVFSGTVAGARTAYIYGKTGIAVSVDSFHHTSEFFREHAEFISDFINEIKDEIVNKPHFFNINFPNISMKEIKGTVYTYSGRRKYSDSFIHNKGEGDDLLLRLDGKIESHLEEGSDTKAVADGYISINPLTISCDNNDYLNRKNFGG